MIKWLDKVPDAWFILPLDFDTPFVIKFANARYTIYSRPDFKELVGPFETLEAAKAALLLIL